jgi:hypothetical protein
MRVEQERANVFALTMTGRELSVLIAAGRMALDAMRADSAPTEAIALLARVLADFDAALPRGDGGASESARSSSA